MRTDFWNNLRLRLLIASALLGAGAAVVGWLSPGGLGEAGPVRVVGGVSAEVYRWVAGAVTGMDPASDGALVVLGVVPAWVWLGAVRRRDGFGVAAGVLIGAGTVAAYALSEALKLVVDEERPCRVIVAMADCPPVGDWAFPSNHATLAAGLGFGVAVLRPRLAPLTVPLAVAAGLLRVLAGVHYPHDVVAGAVLGGCVVVAVLLVFAPVAGRLGSRVLGSRPVAGRSG
ncbi:phosphatase PAP2 family protein [Nonomuraea sp. NPDC050643]|uniref:phosphatase PAP2 family protein n=1 Tax=Nonomuraea sp. NPDC050643 TaxID=3155660 RepID=UPI0033F12AF9